MMQPQIWIGTIEIYFADPDTPSVWKPAFTTVTTWACDADEFGQKCTCMLESYGWKLLAVDRANPVSDNLVINAERWQETENEGYSGWSLSVRWKPLRREPGLLHVLVTVRVNEGTQKRLKSIEIREVGEHKGQPALVSNQLRKLVPLNDGEIYNRDKFFGGLSAVVRAYQERGFIDCTITPTIASDDDNRTVSAVMEITEGPVYRWGNVQVIGLDPKTETILRACLPKDSIVNPKLIRDFYQEHKSSLPVGASPETVEFKRDRQRAVVDVTFDFNTPAPQSIPD